MSITSSGFIAFLAVVVLLYYVIRKPYQKYVLLAANIVFYLYAGPKYMLFLLFTMTTTYFAARKIGELNEEQQRKLAAPGCSKEEKKAIKAEAAGRKKKWLITTLCLNFGILFALKYVLAFLIRIQAMLPMGFQGKIQTIEMGFVLPLGISFYTFQMVGYLIDVYREKYLPEKSYLDYAIFASFFPQMTQGPIGRYDELAPQLTSYHKFDYETIKFGAQRMLWGAFKKLVIADRIAVLSNIAFDKNTPVTGAITVLGMFCYTIQIYADFSGGIDIASGAAEMLGIKMSDNFLRPYFAKDVPEFWRRWHITLGAWFRDYVFYPLSLSKKFNKMSKFLRKKIGVKAGKMLPIIVSQFITFFLVGVWHGSQKKYVVFGFYHGIFIVLTILLEEPLQKLWKKLSINTNCFSWNFLKMMFTFIIVAAGRVITQAASLKRALKMWLSVFRNFRLRTISTRVLQIAGFGNRELVVLTVALLILFCVSLLQERGVHIRETLAKQNLYFRWLVYTVGILFIVIFGMYGMGYNAADFVYRGF